MGRKKKIIVGSIPPEVELKKILSYGGDISRAKDLLQICNSSFINKKSQVNNSKQKVRVYDS